VLAARTVSEAEVSSDGLAKANNKRTITETVRGEAATEPQTADGLGEKENSQVDKEQPGEASSGKGGFKRTSQDNTMMLAAATSPSLASVDTCSTLVVMQKTPQAVPPLPPVYVSPRKQNKRLKNTLVQVSGDNKMKDQETSEAISAGSLEERRRAQ
jgi:hypothetical protein